MSEEKRLLENVFELESKINSLNQQVKVKTAELEALNSEILSLHCDNAVLSAKLNISDAELKRLIKLIDFEKKAMLITGNEAITVDFKKNRE